jgi:hypothetical protein
MGKIINKMFDFLEKNLNSIFYIPKFIFIGIPFLLFLYIYLIAKKSYFFKK